MINASGGSTPTQPNTTSQPTTNPGAGFPTHNPAAQHQQFMKPTQSSGTTTSSTTPPVNLGTQQTSTPTNSAVPPKNNTGATPPAAPKFPDPTKKLATKATEGSAGGNGSDTTKPKKKLNLKLVLGVIVLLLIILGSGAGFYMSQYTQQDIRQKAAYEQGCDNGIPHGGTACQTQGASSYWICNDGTYTGPNACPTGETCQGASCKPATAAGCAYPSCDANCSQTSCSVSCQDGTSCQTGKNTFYCEGKRGDGCNDLTSFKENNSGSIDKNNPEHWCTTYQIDSWASTDITQGTQESAAAVGYIGNNGVVCKDQACIDQNPGFWDCDAEEIFACDSACTTTAECQGDLGATYSCVSNKCRLTANPTSATCSPATTTYACDSACTTTAECQGDLGATYSCVSNKCRLTANPTSATCEGAYVPLTCNDPCGSSTEGDRCVLDLGSDYSCDSVSNKCRLVNNPSSATCAAPLVCDSTCNPDADTDLCTVKNDAWSCDATTSKCRLTSNPTSASCEAPVGAVACNESCTTDEECTKTNANYTCDSTSNTCRLSANLTSESCEPYSPNCNESCTTNEECARVDSSHICDATTNTCRLESYPSSDSCQEPEDEPTVGCNDACVTNADCSDSNHICATTSDGSQKCRLESNPDSDSCTLPAGSTAQPTLPPELPETGPADWLNWLKAGLVTLGLGTALFFLL